MSGQKEGSIDDAPYVSEFMDRVPETVGEKSRRKFLGNPFIPFGLVATGACLAGGLWAFRAGKQQLSQNFQRGRVFFQGVTVLAFVGEAGKEMMARDSA
eukprot:m.160367 g.160367  ORF g.160367 m.160367 type:complete len:99 (-) comp11935_c0_seq1:1981-2277(-)